MKKVIALTLAVSLALGMATVAFAATPEINTFKGWFQTDTDAANAAHTYIYSISSITPPSPVLNLSEDLDEIAPGHVAYFYLSGASFDLPPDNASRLTTSVLRNRQNGISLKMRARRGGDVIESVSWRNVTKEVRDSANLVISGATGNAQYPYGLVEVKVEFIDHFVSTGEKEFDIEIFLSKSDWDRDESAIQLTGTLKNNEIEVSENDSEIDLSDGYVAEATAYIQAVRIDTGNRLYVNARLYDGRKYYAMSDNKPTAADYYIMNQYPQIDIVYNLYTVGLNTTGNTVEFDFGETMYVYNEDGQYIGTTNDDLPMSNKYYLATSRIDMGGGDADPEAMSAPSTVSQR